MSTGTLCRLFCAIAEDEAAEALSAAPPRPATEALKAAWEAVHPIMGRLMRDHGYMSDTVERLRNAAATAMKDTANATETAPDVPTRI